MATPRFVALAAPLLALACSSLPTVRFDEDAGARGGDAGALESAREAGSNDGGADAPATSDGGDDTDATNGAGKAATCTKYEATDECCGVRTCRGDCDSNGCDLCRATCGKDAICCTRNKGSGRTVECVLAGATCK